MNPATIIILWAGIIIGPFFMWRGLLAVNRLSWNTDGILMLSNIALTTGGFFIAAAPLYAIYEAAFVGYFNVCVSYAINMKYGRRKYEQHIDNS